MKSTQRTNWPKVTVGTINSTSVTFAHANFHVSASIAIARLYLVLSFLMDHLHTSERLARNITSILDALFAIR